MRYLSHLSSSLLSLSAAAFIAGCAADTTTQPRSLRPEGRPDRATVVNDVRVPVSGALINPCNGEPMIFTGYVHTSFHITFDAGGGVHVEQHFNTQSIQGVGAITGTRYTGNESSNDEFNAKFGFEETFDHHFSMITHGSLPNFELHEIEHITVNANGEVTVFFTDVSAECRG
jgi:hypothetical protein